MIRAPNRPSPLHRRRHLLLRVLPFAVAAIAMSQIGCGAHPWQPAPPQGATYQYDFQGFRASDTTVVAGSGDRRGYAGVFAFRDAPGVHLESGSKDPYAESAVIDGLTFNMHLPGQGARLLPSSGHAAPPPSPAPSTAATNATPQQTLAPTPSPMIGLTR